MNEIVMIKRAFRIAYDFVLSHQHPAFDADYFVGVLAEFDQIRAENQGNVLLDCLLMGIYDYLEKEAKRTGERKQ